VSDAGWRETYRGTVARWEVDTVEHFTVAFYIDRFEHATLTLLDSLGLGPAYARREGRACVTVDGYVRYQRELRAGDILHIRSAVIAVEPGGLQLGHTLINSETDQVCATLEQRVAHVVLDGRKPVELSPRSRREAEAQRVAWDGPARERRPRPRGRDGFLPAGRDTVKPEEIDVLGAGALQFFIHRFSSANAHVLAAFGFTPRYQRERRRGFSTFEFQLEVAGALEPGDLVDVRSGLLHVGTTSLHLCHQLLRGAGEPVALLHQLGVHLDLDARRPAPLPDELRDRARALVAPSDPA
jgi:acyl-CoA thioester hydrolase